MITMAVRTVRALPRFWHRQPQNRLDTNRAVVRMAI